MKRIAIILMLGALIFTMSACGNEAGNGESMGRTENTQESTQEAIQESTDPAVGSGTTDPGTFGGEEGWSTEMESVKAAIVATLGDNYFPNMALEPDMLEERFGISMDMYDDYLAEIPMISANVDTLVIVKAKDDKVQEVADALDAYRDAQINDAFQYPQNIGIVQGSRIERIGNYVCFAQLGGDVTDILDSGDEAVILHCQELNELVIELIGQNVKH